MFLSWFMPGMDLLGGGGGGAIFHDKAKKTKGD